MKDKKDNGASICLFACEQLVCLSAAGNIADAAAFQARKSGSL
jgi:hypothetical protein